MQAETATIVAAAGNSIKLSQALQNMHWGSPLSVPGTSKTFSECAEVALLTRNIVIQGGPNDPSTPFIGGHFIIHQTPSVQFIEGVELVNMGQQGSLGRYPLHFHLLQDATGTTARKNSVHDSNQRCIVVHGTYNVLIDDNVAFRTFGHCYVLEDGIEYGNTFSDNLGFLQEPVKTIITAPAGTLIGTESDDSPSTFWISNPSNNFINNVAGGSFDSGWWFQLNGNVEGASALLPTAKAVQPKFSLLGTFSGNVGHSNGRAGLRTYPDGYRPRVQNGQGINAPPVDVAFVGFRAYKNVYDGMFIHESDSITVDSAVLADNGVGVEFNQDQACAVKSSLFVGLSANVGTPQHCDQKGNEYENCRPLVGCTLPVSPSQARSVGGVQVSRPQFGILIDQSEYPSHGRAYVPNHISDCTFVSYDTTCRVSAAITANGNAQSLFNAGHSVQGLSFPDNANRMYFAPRLLGMLGFESQGDAGEEALMYVLRDIDGTLIGGNGGYAVTNNAAMLPPGPSTCTLMPTWNGYSCPGSCYRTVGFGVGSCSIMITQADGQVLTLSGAGGYNGWIFANLLSGVPHQVTVTAGNLPAQFMVMYGDDDSCNGGIVLQFTPPSGSQWTVQPTPSVFWQACQGTDFLLPQQVTQVGWICGGADAVLQVSMGAVSPDPLKLIMQPGTPSCSTLQCGLFLPGSTNWSYDDSGAEDHPSFASVIYPQASSWKVGTAQFGYGNVGEVTKVATSTPTLATWYFRRLFTVSNAKCYSSLVLGALVDDGLAIYLNGQQIYSSNLPAILTTRTQAISDISPTSDWSSATVALSPGMLLEGTNVIAAEMHSAYSYAWELRFDAWLAAIGSLSCLPEPAPASPPPPYNPTNPPPPPSVAVPTPLTSPSSPPPPVLLSSPPPPQPQSASSPPPISFRPPPSSPPTLSAPPPATLSPPPPTPSPPIAQLSPPVVPAQPNPPVQRLQPSPPAVTPPPLRPPVSKAGIPPPPASIPALSAPPPPPPPGPASPPPPHVFSKKGKKYKAAHVCQKGCKPGHKKAGKKKVARQATTNCVPLSFRQRRWLSNHLLPCPSVYLPPPPPNPPPLTPLAPPGKTKGQTTIKKKKKKQKKKKLKKKKKTTTTVESMPAEHEDPYGNLHYRRPPLHAHKDAIMQRSMRGKLARAGASCH
eukprot:SM000109S14134  [mRNA]  locus=s109:55084:61209:- [translate_table: standard]